MMTIIMMTVTSSIGLRLPPGTSDSKSNMPVTVSLALTQSPSQLLRRMPGTVTALTVMPGTVTGRDGGTRDSDSVTRSHRDPGP